MKDLINLLNAIGPLCVMGIKILLLGFIPITSMLVIFCLHKCGS